MCLDFGHGNQEVGLQNSSWEPKIVHSRVSCTHWCANQLVTIEVNEANPIDLLALLSELTRYSPGQQGLLLPGFRRIGHPVPPAGITTGQLGKFPWQDFHLLERQLASLQHSGMGHQSLGRGVFLHFPFDLLR